MEWRAAGRMVVPATLGSVLGVIAAEMLPNRDMGLIITVSVLVALLLLFTRLKEALAKDRGLPPHITALGLFALAFVGIWLGFIVLDGATYLLLVLILLFRFDLPRANALKVLLLSLVVLIFCEIAPKTIALQRAERVALRLARIVTGATFVMRPIVGVLTGITKLLLRLTGRRQRCRSGSEIPRPGLYVRQGTEGRGRSVDVRGLSRSSLTTLTTLTKVLNRTM